LNYTESDLEPLPPAVRRSLRGAAAAISVVVLLVLLWVAAYIGLIFGWHPIATTALGCSPHKRFHSANGPLVESENLLLATDCLKVTLFGREDVIRDAQKIEAVRRWLDPARTSGLKISSTLVSVRARDFGDRSAVENGGRWRRLSRAPDRDVTVT
jgi:hypothetical protein